MGIPVFVPRGGGAPEAIAETASEATPEFASPSVAERDEAAPAEQEATAPPPPATASSSGPREAATSSASPPSAPSDPAAPDPTHAPPHTSAAATMQWPELEAAVASCVACPLHETRRNTVFGTGARDAEWMVIGEAPGAHEDRLGEPFVGPAGHLLDAMLFAIGLKREQVYIANILKCRPPGNRDPEAGEIHECAPYLERQIELLAPRVLVFAGRVAAQTLLATHSPLGRLRGREHTHITDDGRRIPVVATYHPAYLLRNPRAKRDAWEDLLFARSIVARERG